jgi:ABC-type polar amino acid transport system ATPase subunit
MSSIVKLSIVDYMLIQDIEISPGKITQIVGSNSQGKTAIIKALQWLFEGGNDTSVIRNGADSTEVMVKLADNTTIKRRLTKEGKTSLDIRKGEFKVTAPQSYLEQILGSEAFNPIELLDPKNRHDAIMSAIDLKISTDSIAKELGVEPGELPPVEWSKHGLEVLNDLHRYFYQRRAEANRTMAEAKKKWQVHEAELPTGKEAPETSKADLESRIKKLDTELMKAEIDLNAIAERTGMRQKALDRVAKYEGTLRSIRDEISILKSREEECIRWLEEAKNQTPPADSIPDRTDLVAKAEKAKEERSAARELLAKWAEWDELQKRVKMVKELEGEYVTQRNLADNLTIKVEKLNGELQSKAMASAEMPITGLEYKDGKFLVDGISVDNLSTSKAMMLAIGIARKLSKKTKVIVVDGVEALDEETFKAFRNEIAGDGFTYVITKVGEPFESKEEDLVITMDKGKVMQ